MTLKELYNDFKLTVDYRNRLKQTEFSAIAREIIIEKLKMDQLTKLDLTGFIQMFAWRGNNEAMFIKYFHELKFDQKFYDEWMAKTKETGAGYTAVGKTSINVLAPAHSVIVKKLLSGIRDVKTVQEAKEIVTNYDKYEIPEVTMGIYSPWVHYLQPRLCPIVNGGNKEYLVRMNWDRSYAHAIDIFQELAKETGESDLGIIDAMFWKTSVANKVVSIYNKFKRKPTPVEETILMKNQSEFALNTILYGPPGTGKTYNSINYALKIIHNDPEFCTGKDRKELVDEFNKLKDDGLIEFITFHQSYHYEDFIEGIRPYTENDTVKYRIDDGIFKKISNRAEIETTQPIIENNIQFDDVDYFKMSLGNTLDPEDEIVYDYCMENNCIALGYGENNDFSQVPHTPNAEECYPMIQEIYGQQATKFGIQAVFYFKNLMEINDLVFISRGNTKIRAIGRITGEYEYRADSPIGYYQFRSVEWLINDKEFDSINIYGKTLSQMTIYQFNKKHLSIDRIQRLLDKKKYSVNNYVLIIDEINRGNISKIFGELITLVENDKRLGMTNQITTRLPYSDTSFGVPKNLFILGTMNTADRSTALVDIALRRRFRFVPLYPDYELIKNDDMRALLECINSNIVEELGPDYQIGHSYFIEKELKDLDAVLNDSVLPLLNEYFYGDNEKILSMFSGSDIVDNIKYQELCGKKLTKGRLSYQA